MVVAANLTEYLELQLADAREELEELNKLRQGLHQALKAEESQSDLGLIELAGVTHHGWKSTAEMNDTLQLSLDAAIIRAESIKKERDRLQNALIGVLSAMQEWGGKAAAFAELVRQNMEL